MGRTLRSNRHVRAMDGHCKLERKKHSLNYFAIELINQSFFILNSMFNSRYLKICLMANEIQLY